ncbi:MAG: hypothetical protein GY696_35190 [Gammaproteobacteria bacterium]|nr:hypothetical protein [Gammaproteobacteria bacterium]
MANEFGNDSGVLVLGSANDPGTASDIFGLDLVSDFRWGSRVSWGSADLFGSLPPISLGMTGLRLKANAEHGLGESSSSVNISQSSSSESLTRRLSRVSATGSTDELDLLASVDAMDSLDPVSVVVVSDSVITKFDGVDVSEEFGVFSGVETLAEIAFPGFSKQK